MIELDVFIAQNCRAGGCGSGPEDLPSMCRALCSVLSTENKHRIKTKTCGSGEAFENEKSLPSLSSFPLK